MLCDRGAILLTQQCVGALAFQPPGLIDRGTHALKGKSSPVQIFSLDQETYAQVGLTS
jgi:adenylate cyclase